MNKQKAQVLSLAPLPQKFNWKLYQKIANSSFIKNEETAVFHFRKNAQLDSALRNKYFREHLHIPEEFDEELYIELLKNDYNIKMKSGSVSHEKLYMFYETQGKKKYPFNSTYYKNFYKIPSEFNEELYKSVYMFSNKKNEFNEKINNAKNIYEVYHKYKTEFPIDDGYLKKFYNIPHIFDPNIYNKIYNVSSDTSEVYQHCVNNKNAFLNNETYLRTYYGIPESFNEKKYVERYPDVEKFLHAHTLQEKYETLVKLILQKPLDSEYYKLLDGLNIKEYKELVLNKTSITNDEAYKIYKNNNTEQTKNTQPQMQVKRDRVEVVALETIYSNSEDKFNNFYNFLYNRPDNLHKFLQNKYEEVNVYLKENKNKFKIDVYNENFYNNYIDPSLIPHNNITKYEFVKKNLSEEKINQFYDYCKENTQIINKFNKAYEIINNCNYTKIKVNKKKYYDTVELSHEFYTIDNSNKTLRGVLCNENIIQSDMNTKCIKIANEHEFIYCSIINFYKNLELFNKTTKRLCTLNINYIVPSNNQYHYAILISNLLFIERECLSANYAINIYATQEHHEYEKFRKQIENISCLNIKFIKITNPSELDAIFMDDIDIIFSSNVYFTSNHKAKITNTRNLLINCAINNETLAKSIKIKSCYQ